jgi:hypothetical protein
VASRATSIHGPGGRNKSGRAVPRFIVPARSIRAGLFAANDNHVPLALRLRRMARIAAATAFVCGLVWLLFLR